MLQKFAVGAHVNFGVVLEGVREGPWEKQRSDDARAGGVGGNGATPCRAALYHGGRAGF